MTRSENVTRTVLVEQNDPIAIVTINRPAKYNAINREIVDELDAAFTALEAEPSVRAIVLTGVGRAFAAGADIAFYAAADRAAFASFTRRCNALCDRIANSAVPVVAAVNGVALGGGFELVLSCDVVVAAHEASFGFPEVSLGLLPGWGGTQRLTWHVGLNRAKWLVMSAERLDTDAAQAAGIVTHSCAREDLAAQAVQVATTLSRQAPLAVAAIREAVTAAIPGAAEASSGVGFRFEREKLSALFGSADGSEGITAFVEKRPARFLGR